MITAFVGEFRVGALVAFVVTDSEVQPFGIGAAFWGGIVTLSALTSIDTSV